MESKILKNYVDYLILGASREREEITFRALNVNEDFLSTFNGEIGLFARNTGDILDNETAFDIFDLSQILAVMPVNIALSVDAKAVHVKSKGFKTKFKKLPYTEPFAIPKNPEWKELDPNFTDGISLCSMTMSADPAMYALLGICLYGKTIFSTNGISTSEYQIQDDMGTLIIPKVAIKPIEKLDPHYYFVDDKVLWLTDKEKSKGMVIRLIDINSPPFNSEKDRKATIEGIILDAKNFEGEKVILPENIKSLVSSMIFSKSGETDILKISDGKMKSENDKGVTEVNLAINKEIKFNINPKNFSEIVSLSKEISINEDSSFIKIEDGVFTRTDCLIHSENIDEVNDDDIPF